MHKEELNKELKNKICRVAVVCPICRKKMRAKSYANYSKRYKCVACNKTYSVLLDALLANTSNKAIIAKSIQNNNKILIEPAPPAPAVEPPPPPAPPAPAVEPPAPPAPPAPAVEPPPPPAPPAPVVEQKETPEETPKEVPIRQLKAVEDEKEPKKKLDPSEINITEDRDPATEPLSPFIIKKQLDLAKTDLVLNIRSGIYNGDRQAQQLFLKWVEQDSKIKRKTFTPDDYKRLLKQIFVAPNKEYQDEFIKTLVESIIIRQKEKSDDEDKEDDKQKYTPLNYDEILLLAQKIYVTHKHKISFFCTIGYMPHARQMGAHMSFARFKIVAAGARGGKSMLAGAEAAYAFMYPDVRIWCVSSHYDLADKEFDWALTFLAKIEYQHNEIQLVDICDLSNPKRGGRSITAPWSSFIKTKSAEKPDSLLGEELDMAVMGEASQVAINAWERFLRPRLGPRHGVLWAISTPNSDAGLFMDMFLKGKTKDNEWSQWESWQFSTLDNPHFDPLEYEIARKELDEKIFKEQYEGCFVSRRGVVFTLLNANKTSDFDKDYVNWSCVYSCVYGYNNPFVVLLMYIHPDPEKKIYYIKSEIYLKKTPPKDIIKMMNEQSKGKRLHGIIVDYSDYIMQRELTDENLPFVMNDEKTHNKEYALLRKIILTQSLLKKKNIFIDKNCENLIDEVNNLQWRDKPSDKSGKADSEIPLTKYLQAPKALVNAIAFFEKSRGVDVYNLNTKYKSKDKR